LKTHHAPEFFTSLLNNQPMGFYSSATLIKDGQRHGLKFLPVSVQESDWLCQTTERENTIRLGLCVVKTLAAGSARRLLSERGRAPFASLTDFKKRVRLNKDELRTLAEIGALNGLADHRRAALWETECPSREGDLFEAVSGGDKKSPLAPMTYPERIQSDFSGMRLTTGKHPMALLRPHLTNVWRAADLPSAENGSLIRIAGNVICRQRPGTAKGFVFISLEDETGVSNAVVTPPMFEANRLVITEEAFLVIEGRLQNADNVIHIRAEIIQRLDHAAYTGAQSYDFH
jgi:error-prone DNA polymerase